MYRSRRNSSCFTTSSGSDGRAGAFRRERGAGRRQGPRPAAHTDAAPAAPPPGMVSGGRRGGRRARAAGVWRPRPCGHVTSDTGRSRPGRRSSARPLSQGGTVMADAHRTAEAVWEGSLAQGTGAVTLTSSGAAGPLPVTWASRTARSEGKTSPEELVAAAHASCYCMALSGILGEAGTAPQKLQVSATVTFAQVEGGFKVASSALKLSLIH